MERGRPIQHPCGLRAQIDSAPGGNTNLIGDVATINNDAAWEYLVQTRFSTNGVSGTTNSVAPLVHDAAGSSTNASTGGVLKGVGIDTAELKIPWSLIGGAPPVEGKRLRFTVATLYSDRTNAADSVASGSAVMDAMHPTQTSEADLADGSWITSLTHTSTPRAMSSRRC